MGLKVVSDTIIRLEQAFLLPEHPDRKAALAMGRFNRLRHDEVIVSPHHERPEVHYIVSGRIRVIMHGPNGNDRVVSILGPGLLAGESHLLMPGRITTVYALGTVETYSWDVETAAELVQTNPAFAMQVITSLAFKAKIFAAQIEALSFCSASERVARIFYNLAEIYGEPVRDRSRRIRLRVTQEDIGEMANASRVTVSKVVSRLRRQGILSKQRGWYIVNDLQKLLGISNDNGRIRHYPGDTVPLTGIVAVQNG